MGNGNMTAAQALEAVRTGGRARTDTSLHEYEDTAKSATCYHAWRTVACDNETDVIECSRCGKQQTCACDFDEEYA